MERKFRESAKRGIAARSSALAAADPAAAADEPFKALVINMESSPQRFDNISVHLESAGIAFERVPGIRGSDLSRFSVRRLAPNWAKAINGDDRLGTLGCFLGHVKAWERVANGDGRVHLILEDDAAPRGVLPRSLSSLAVAPDFDFCFANTRMEHLFADGQALPERPTLYTAMEARLSRPEIQKAIGGEAYFLTKAGAQKLLEVVDRTGPFTHVDWFLFIVGVSEEQAKTFPPNERAGRVYRRFSRHLEPARDIHLRAMALWPALMGPSGMGSTRKAENVTGARTLAPAFAPGDEDDDDA